MNSVKSIIDDDFVGERASFLQLIKDYYIVIPVIQRDYAQGRIDSHVEEIRKNFVEDLISYIKDSQKASHDLDFIYGTVNDLGQGRLEFVPLDGQQRLTTLFLLHLYIAGRCGHFNEFETMMKGRFSYKTRSSSTMFCEKIISTYKVTELKKENGKKQYVDRETNIFEELRRMETVGQDKSCGNSESRKIPMLSKTIQNQGWFFKSWLQDPTVAGMLVMLDEIDSQFINDDESLCQKAYERIFEHGDDENPPVTFQKLPLNGYSRTDDLYIKMNARGIHLTDFENFKARIEDLIEDNEFDFKDVFKKKVDVAWSEYLWKYHGKDDNTDRVMENLFRNFIAFSYRVNADKATIKDRMNYLLEQNGKSMRFTFTSYCNLEVFHKRNQQILPERTESEKNTIRKVIDFFDIFCNETTHPAYNENDWFQPSTFIDKCFVNKDATFSNRLRLYAYLQYQRTHTASAIDESDLKEWMRLVRNLDDATDIDDAEKFYNAICSIDDILDKIGSKKVQEWLSNDARNYSIKFFRGRQMKEECIKAELRKVEERYGLSDIFNVISKCDHDPYLTGQMGFILEFSECYDKYNDNTIITMEQKEIESCANTMKEYADKAICLFDLLSKENNAIVLDCKLERALLTIGMYMRENSAKRFNFCNIMKDPYNSWKTLLFMEDNAKDSRKCFKILLDKVSIEHLEADLDKIIIDAPNNLPLWRRKIISQKELIQYCNQGFIYVEKSDELNEDEPDIILLSQSQMNHYHSELWTRELYNRLNSTYTIHYHAYKKYEDDTTVYISFSDGNKHFTFELSHWNKKWYFVIYDEERNDVTASCSIANKINSEEDGESILKQAYDIISHDSTLAIF